MLCPDHMVDNMTARCVTPAVTKPSLAPVAVHKGGGVVDAAVRAAGGGQGQQATAAAHPAPTHTADHLVILLVLN